MPHLVLEYSAPLAESHDLQALCRTLCDGLAQLPDVPTPQTLKIRTQPCPAWAFGTGAQSFVHGNLHGLPGRTEEQKAALTGAVLDMLDRALPDVESLTVDYFELSSAYAKRTL